MKQIYVYWDDVQTESPIAVGTLFADSIRGKEVFSFEFDGGWLKQNICRHLDPDLQFFSGPQYVSAKKANFGIFTDSCPDRWGRVLIERRESIRAKEEGTSKGNAFISHPLCRCWDMQTDTPKEVRIWR